MKFTFSGNKLQAQIQKVERQDRKAVNLALGQVGLAILQDINDKEPKPPFETGFLRGAQFLYVNGSEQKVPGAIGTNLPASINYDKTTFEVTVGLNTPYARKMHELLGVSIFPTQVSRRGTPKDTSGVGGKFLEKKLAMFKNEYAKIFADAFNQFRGKK